jgi:hypothetical protein
VTTTAINPLKRMCNAIFFLFHFILLSNPGRHAHQE